MEGNVAQQLRKSKDLQARIDELEEELEAERQARMKVRFILHCSNIFLFFVL